MRILIALGQLHPTTTGLLGRVSMNDAASWKRLDSRLGHKLPLWKEEAGEAGLGPAGVREVPAW